MPLNYETITQNKLTYVQGNEIINKFLPATNTFVQFHGIQAVNTMWIQFTVKRNVNSVAKWDRNSKQTSAAFVKTDVIRKSLEVTYTAGEQVANQVLQADVALNLPQAMTLQILNDLTEQIYKDSVANYKTYVTPVTLNADASGVYTTQQLIDAMIGAYQTAFSTNRTLNATTMGQWKYWLNDNDYNLLTGIKSNQTGNLQAYNVAAQNIVWNGTQLYFKGILCEVLRDDAFGLEAGATGDKFGFYLTSAQFLKFYALESTSVYSQPIQDDAPGKRVLFAGEVTMEGYPYLATDETVSRWGYGGKITTATPPVLQSSGKSNSNNPKSSEPNQAELDDLVHQQAQSNTPISENLVEGKNG